MPTTRTQSLARQVAGMEARVGALAAPVLRNYKAGLGPAFAPYFSVYLDGSKRSKEILAKETL